jgi:hypothetical protein
VAEEKKPGGVIWIKSDPLIQELKQITADEPGAKLYQVTERLLRRGIAAEKEEKK